MDEEPLTRLRGTAVVRPGSARLLGAAMMLSGAIALLAAALDGVPALLDYGGLAVLFAVVGWAVFWRPHVEVSDGGVRLANTLRAVEVPWPAVETVDGRYGLRLGTAYGRYTAWGAGAPSGRDRQGAPDSPASRAVEQRLEELRRAGHLDNPRLERSRPVVVWEVPVIAFLAASAVASVVLPLLT